MGRYLLVALLITTQAFAQMPETLTNNDILTMTKAGLSAETIIAKISTSRTAFSVDTQGLVALKQAGVPDTVITAMLHASHDTVPAPPPTSSQPFALESWTPTSAKPIRRAFRLTGSDGGAVFVLHEYPDQGAISACPGSLVLDERELYVGASEWCEAAPGFTLPWQRITSFCYRYEETIPTPQLGRRWHGTLRITAGDREYLVGLYTREQLDRLRSFLHAYRGNIPEQCADGSPAAVVTPAASGFPIIHPYLQYRPDKLTTCQGSLVLDAGGLRYDAGECTPPLVVLWERITRMCYEEGFWTGRQLTFYGTKGEEWNFYAPSKDAELALRALHDQLTRAKPGLTDHCD
jgi:hypothetical protein